MSDDRRIATVLEITEALCSKTEYAEVVPGALAASLRTVDAEAGSILLHSPDDDALVFEYVLGPVAGRLVGNRLPSGRGVAGRVFSTGVPLPSNDVPGEEAHLRGMAQQIGYPSRSMVMVPFRALGGRRRGGLQAINKRQGEFAQADLELLTIVAAQVAAILENARPNEAARLGTAAQVLANTGHDVKDMIAPVIASAGALQAILNRHFAFLAHAAESAQQSEATTKELAQQAEKWRERRCWVQEILARAAERVRTLQMADRMRGTVSPPCLKPTRVPEVVREVRSVLGPWAEEGGIPVKLAQDDVCRGLLRTARTCLTRPTAWRSTPSNRPHAAGA